MPPDVRAAFQPFVTRTGAKAGREVELRSLQIGPPAARIQERKCSTWNIQRCGPVIVWRGRPRPRMPPSSPHDSTSGTARASSPVTVKDS